MFFLNKMCYTYGYKKNIVSIAMYTDYMLHNFEVYNVSLVTGEEVSDEQVLAVYGLSREQFEVLVRKTLEASLDRLNPETVSQEYIEYARTETLSDQNISEAVPFIGADGQLCFMAREYFLAGSGQALYLYDTQTGTNLDWKICKEKHDVAEVEVKRELTPDEAYLKACEFWGVTQEDVEEMKPEMWISRSDGFEYNNGNRFYKFYLRQLNDNGSAGTLDVVFVNVMTGKASWSMDE